MNEPDSRSGGAVPRPAPETWLDEHGDALYRYALARVRDRSAAEDLVQETLLAAMRGLDDFSGASTERTWLVGILRHKLLDHFRRLGRERDLHDDGAAVDEAGDFDAHERWRTPPAAWSAPERALDDEQFWRAFDSCIEALPEKLRTPFILRELEGLDTPSLTGLFSVTKSNLWAMLSRARQRLRRCLSHLWFEA